MAILDHRGNPMALADKPGERPEQREILVASIRDKYSSYPSRGLTPQRLATIFREADGGEITRQAELFNEMEEKSTHIFSVFQTRKLAVVKNDLEVLAASDRYEDQEIAEFVRANITALPDFTQDLTDALDAIAKGFSALEITWDVAGGEVRIEDLEWKSQRRFTYNWWSAASTLRILTDEEPIRGIEIPDNKFVIHQCRARSGAPSRQGLLRTCAWMYLFANYAVKDWVAFAEIYGMPLRLGKYKPGTKQEDKDVILEALTNLGSDAAALIPEGATIEFKEAISGGADVYLALSTFCNKEISKAVLGQTATTEDTPGKLGAAPEKSQVRQDLVEADSRALENTLRDQLVKPLVDFNFGIQENYPRPKFHCEPAQDLRALAYRDRALAGMGVPIPLSYARKTYGIPEPEGKDDPILVPQELGAEIAAKDEGGQIWVLKKKIQPGTGGIAESSSTESG